MQPSGSGGTEDSTGGSGVMGVQSGVSLHLCTGGRVCLIAGEHSSPRSAHASV